MSPLGIANTTEIDSTEATLQQNGFPQDCPSNEPIIHIDIGGPALNIPLAMPPMPPSNFTETDATEAPSQLESRPEKRPRKVRPCKLQLSSANELERTIDDSSSDDEGLVQTIVPPANVEVTLRYVNGWSMIERRTLTPQEIENRRPNLYHRYLEERRRWRREQAKEQADKLRQLKSQKKVSMSPQKNAAMRNITSVQETETDIIRLDNTNDRLQEIDESMEQIPESGTKEVDKTMINSSCMTVTFDKSVDDCEKENEKEPENTLIVAEADIHATNDDLVTSNNSDDDSDYQVEEEELEEDTSCMTTDKSDEGSDYQMDEEKKPKEDASMIKEVQHKTITDNLVPIGDGHARVPSSLLKRLDWSSHTNATRKLLSAVFPRKVLATHSLTGRPSPAFPNKPAKKRLDSELVRDIVQTVAKRCKVAESLVRVSITTKCADEAKMLRNRTKAKKENISPPDSDSP